jgi:hypothetical protein
MVVFRVIALLFLVVALMLLGADIVSTLELGGQFVTRSLEAVIALVTGASAQGWIEGTFPAPAASLFITVVSLPGWLPTGLLGVLLAFAAGRGRARV